jgi:hypothetical protein
VSFLFQRRHSQRAPPDSDSDESMFLGEDSDGNSEIDLAIGADSGSEIRSEQAKGSQSDSDEGLHLSTRQSPRMLRPRRGDASPERGDANPEMTTPLAIFNHIGIQQSISEHNSSASKSLPAVVPSSVEGPQFQRLQGKVLTAAELAAEDPLARNATHMGKKHSAQVWSEMIQTGRLFKKSQNWNLGGHKVRWGRNLKINNKEKDLRIWIDFVGKGACHPHAWVKDKSRPDLMTFGFRVNSEISDQSDWLFPELGQEHIIDVAERIIQANEILQQELRGRLND